MNFLTNLEIILGLGKGFNGDGYDGDRIKEFKFDRSVNGNGGYIRYPYGYEGFITIHATDRQTSRGLYEFRINYINNNKNLVADQNIKSMKLREQKFVYENVEDVQIVYKEHEDA